MGKEVGQDCQDAGPFVSGAFVLNDPLNSLGASALECVGTEFSLLTHRQSTDSRYAVADTAQAMWLG